MKMKTKHANASYPENPDIVFDESAKPFVLEMLNKSTDKQGYIIEKDTGKRVLTFELEELRLAQFGGIQKGSEIFIEDNLVSLIRLIKLKG